MGKHVMASMMSLAVLALPVLLRCIFLNRECRR
jgi:hypothetical protein